MAPLNILSLNVQGPNVPQKRVKAFRSFQSKKKHTLYVYKRLTLPRLQPLNFSVLLIPKFTPPRRSLKKRGTLIAFHRSTPFTLHSEIKDPEGRYLILMGYIMDTAVTVVSYYAPNYHPVPFLSHLFNIINTHKMGSIFICGDSNQVLLPFPDKTPYTPLRTQDTRSLSQLLSRHNLIDSWRESNPAKRNYTYFSNPHQTFSRIDHIFVTIGMVPEVILSKIIPIPWSDHNEVYTSVPSTIPKEHGIFQMCYLNTPPTV